MWNFLFFCAGVAVTYLATYIQMNRKKNIRKKIEALESHIEYVKKINGSSDELFRKAFMWLFAVFFLISTGLFLPKIAVYFATITGFSGLNFLFDFFSLILFMSASMISAMEFKDYSDLINFQKAMERVNKKKKKLEQKRADS